MSPVEFHTDELAAALTALDEDPRWIEADNTERAELLIAQLRETVR